MAGFTVVANIAEPVAVSFNSAKPRPVAAPTSGNAFTSSTKVWLKLSAPPLVELMTYCPRNCLPTVSRNCSLMELANTAVPVTNATPMSTGAAVRAVRVGFRWTLPRAMVPVTPRRRSTGVPSTRAMGLAITGPASNTPTITTTTAMPRNTESAPATTATMRAAPTTPHSTETAMRNLTRGRCSVAAPARAATGETRPAINAGARAATTVVSKPATSVTTTAVGVITSRRAGMPNPA